MVGMPENLALPGFKTRVGFTNHKQFAAPPDHFAITVTGFGGFEGGKHFHDVSPWNRVVRNFTAGHCNGNKRLVSNSYYS